MMEDKEKTKEQRIEEIGALKKRVTDLEALEREYTNAEQELKAARDELKIQAWGLAKSDEAIKSIYKELEKKNKELQKLDKLKSDFVHTVSHELRTPLTTIREGISQVLDGILGATTPEQREFLSICLEDVDRLKRIIDNLLDISKLEAGEVKITREELDLVGLAKGVASSFYPKAQSKNLEIKESYPQEKVMVYFDKDSIIQVLTNLVGNALKFTDKGYIEISVVERSDCVECSVSDTGRGIAEDDLPKVFSKFQQFGRTDGPGEKGTGLGLSISKSIIELHRGHIRIESRLHEGTKFIFMLPKYTAAELCRQYVREGLKEAIKKGTPLSILAFGTKDIEAVSRRIGSERINSIMQGVANLVKQSLRRKADVVVVHAQTILAVLPETEKEKTSAVSERIRLNIDNYLSKEKANSEIEIFHAVISYPEDGTAEEDILAKIAGISPVIGDLVFSGKDE